MTIRKTCLTDSEDIVNVVQSLLKELEGDYFLNALKECSECQTGLDRATAINLHCQLKSVYDILTALVETISSMKDLDSRQIKHAAK